MNTIYTNEEIEKATKEKHKQLAIWLITLFVFLAVEIAMFTVFLVKVEVAQDRSLQTPFTVASVIVAIIYSFCSLAFFGVKYRYTKAYVKMFADMKSGNRDKSRGVVLSVNQDSIEKDSVKFYGMEVECPPIRREQRNVRTLLIERNHSIDVKPGDKIEFIAHSGIMIGYKIIETAEERK